MWVKIHLNVFNNLCIARICETLRQKRSHHKIPYSMVCIGWISLMALPMMPFSDAEIMKYLLLLNTDIYLNI